MSRPYGLAYPLQSHREQIETFLSGHPKGAAIRRAMLSLKFDPRPKAYNYSDIDPETELAFLDQLPGVPVDDDLRTILRRSVPRCRIEVEGCEIIFDVDEKRDIVFLFKIQETKSS